MDHLAPRGEPLAKRGVSLDEALSFSEKECPVIQQVGPMELRGV